MLDMSRLLAQAGELDRAAEWARRAAAGSGLETASSYASSWNRQGAWDAMTITSWRCGAVRELTRRIRTRRPRSG